MSVRPHKTKPGTWIIDYLTAGRSGQRIRLPFHGTKSEAYELEQRARLESRGTHAPSLFPRVNEVIPEFMAWYRLDHQPGGVSRTMQSIALLLPMFGAVQFPNISEAMVEAYKRSRLDHVKRTTINKELAALSKLCKWAKRKGYCASVPVIDRFPDRMTKAPLPDVPDQDDIDKMIAAIPWPKQGIFYCLYYGGLRKSEAVNLRAEDVQLAARTMFIYGKGGKQRVVPILKYLEPILARRLGEVQKGLLWASESGAVLYDLRETIQWACKRAGVKAHITPHSLRHAFGVRAVKSGVHLRTIQLILGHSSSKVTELYTHLASGQIIAEMERF